MTGPRSPTGTSVATYFVSPSVTFESARTFLTHSASPRVDTRYLTPPTSGTTTGICCGCLLTRLVTVSVWLLPTPVAIATLLKILRTNHGGFMYAIAPSLMGGVQVPQWVPPILPCY